MPGQLQAALYLDKFAAVSQLCLCQISKIISPLTSSSVVPSLNHPTLQHPHIQHSQTQAPFIERIRMPTLSIPFSASLQRAKAVNKYMVSAPRTESSNGSAGTRPRAKDKPSTTTHSAPRRRDQKRQSLPDLANVSTRKTPRRRQSSSTIEQTKKPVLKQLTKNYMHMVQDFNAIKMYGKQANGDYLPTSLCVLCETVLPNLIFFPCQHRCVCDKCLVLNDIMNEPTSPMSWTACPVCMAEIKLMLPHTGNEEDLYWKWALEFPPTLPKNFREEFKDSGTRLHRGSAAVQPDTAIVETKLPLNSVDAISRTRKSLPSIPYSTRRFSLAHRRGSVGGGPNRVAESGKCTIL